jgi:hypothetical protein
MTAAGLLVAALALTACGQRSATAPGTASPAAQASPGASPYVDPGVVGDGAPHYQENNAYRRPGEMSAAGEEAAQAEARRIEPVLKRLWKERRIDPDAVRAALKPLGYPDDKLTVRSMYARFEDDHEVTPPGTMVGLRVRADACVTAWVQEANYAALTNGPYLETGCFEPPSGH